MDSCLPKGLPPAVNQGGFRVEEAFRDYTCLTRPNLRNAQQGGGIVHTTMGKETLEIAIRLDT
jgi:hypothetical protein